MRALRGIGGARRPPRLVDEFPDAIDVIDLPRHENLQVVCEADQASVKHPVSCPGERDTIGEDVRSLTFDRSYMRRLDFGATAAVDELESRNGAAAVVSVEHPAPENAIT